MSIFLERLPDYYHYRWSSAVEEPSVQSALNLLGDTKDSILSNYISQYAGALQQFQQNTGINITDEQSGILDFAADESLTPQDLEQVLSQAMTANPVSGSDLGGAQQLVAAVQRLNQEARENNQKLTSLSNLMDAFTNAKDLYQQVEDAILGEGGNLTMTARSKSIVIQRVVRNILASPDGSEWTQNLKGNTIQGLSNRLNQWLVLLYALTNNQAPRGNKTAIKNAILQVVQDNFSGLVGALGEVAGLTASTVATVQYAETLNKHMKEIESQLETKGRVSGGTGFTCSVKVNNDEYTQAILGNLKSQLLALNGKQFTNSGNKVSITFPRAQIKADQQIWSDTLQASINNVSVKTTTNIRTLKSGEQRVKNITLQSASPLLSLLYRELDFSSNTIVGLLQIAMANGEGGSEADSAWYDLREYTKQALIIPALTGLGRESLDSGNIATMIKINDYLIPMPSFINYIQAMFMRRAGSLGKEFSGYISLEGFPTRAKFTALNKWAEPSTNNWRAAKRRSLIAETSGMSLLQSAKIRMRLRNLNLSMLINSAI